MNRRQLGSFLDKMRCDRPVGISEYGAGGNHLQHAERPKNLYITAAFTPKNTKPSAMNHFFGKSTGGTTFGLLLYGICLTSARMDAMKEIAPA